MILDVLLLHGTDDVGIGGRTTIFRGNVVVVVIVGHGVMIDKIGNDGKISSQDGEGDNDIIVIFLPIRATRVSRLRLYCWSQFYFSRLGVTHERHLSGHLSLFLLATG